MFWQQLQSWSTPEMFIGQKKGLRLVIDKYELQFSLSSVISFLPETESNTETAPVLAAFALMSAYVQNYIIRSEVETTSIIANFAISSVISYLPDTRNVGADTPVTPHFALSSVVVFLPITSSSHAEAINCGFSLISSY